MTGDEGAGLPIESVTVRAEGMEAPKYANYIHMNVNRLQGASTMATLTFISFYNFPLSSQSEKSSVQGDVVARVFISPETALALRDLITREEALLKSPPEAQLDKPTVSRAQRRSRRG